jgi:carboxylesterase
MAKIESFYLEGKNEYGVLLCHTLGGEPAQMMELGKKLNKKGYTVSCPLYPGHAGTIEDMIHTEVTDWYETLKKAYDELCKQTKGVFVIGMSIGGTFTVKLAEEKEPMGIITINAPVIGFDIANDVFNFIRGGGSKDLTERYTRHRTKYFTFVTDLGQIEELKKVTCPLFVLQGSLDGDRYKTSSQLLMYYTNAVDRQRKDYAKSQHLLLQGPDKKEAIKDIIHFIEEIKGA